MELFINWSATYFKNIWFSPLEFQIIDNWNNWINSVIVLQYTPSVQRGIICIIYVNQSCFITIPERTNQARVKNPLLSITSTFLSLEYWGTGLEILITKCTNFELNPQDRAKKAQNVIPTEFLRYILQCSFWGRKNHCRKIFYLKAIIR